MAKQNYSEVNSQMLHRSIIAYSTIGLLLVGVITATISITPLYDRLKLGQEEKLLFAVHNRTVSIQEYISRIKDIALQITSRTKARIELEAFLDKKVTYEKLIAFSNKVLADAKKRSKVIAAIVRISPTGKIVGKLGLDIPSQYIDLAHKNLDEVTMYGPVQIEGEKYLLVSAPIYGKGSKRVGNDIVLFTTTSLQEIVQDHTGLGATGEILLAKRTSNDFTLVFSPKRSNGQKRTVLSTSDIGLALSKAEITKKQTILTGENASDTNAMAYGQITSTSWLILGTMAKEELYADIRAQVINIVKIVFVLIALGTTGMVVLLRPLSGKIMLHTGELQLKIDNSTTALRQELENRKRAETQLERTAKDLSHKAEELSKTNKELDQFAYIVSHDLKAPLRAISNLSGWIAEDLGDDMPQDTKDQITLLQSRVRRMESLIQGILEYSRVGRTNLDAEMVDTKDLINEIVDSIAPDKQFEFVIDPNMPSFVLQRIALQQVFSNLISNAVKYHHKDHGRITITVDDGGDYFRFGVSDDGPGIDADHHEKIFDIFQTLQAKDNIESTGIGLTIVKKMVESQGGAVSVTSKPGEGTDFHFTWLKQNKIGAQA